MDLTSPTRPVAAHRVASKVTSRGTAQHQDQAAGIGTVGRGTLLGPSYPLVI